MLDTLANVGLASLKSGVSPRKTGTNREEHLWGAALLSPSAPVNSLSSERNGGRFDGGPDPAVQEPLRRAADNGWLSSGVFPGRVMLLAVRGRFLLTVNREADNHTASLGGSGDGGANNGSPEALLR